MSPQHHTPPYTTTPPPHLEAGVDVLPPEVLELVDLRGGDLAGAQLLCVPRHLGVDMELMMVVMEIMVLEVMTVVLAP